MKLLFSEQKSDYANYSYSFAIWAVPEAGETPADIFNAGFMPSGQRLDRFYLCRNLRVKLEQFELSSENRRILRKGQGITMELVPRAQFDFTPERRQWFKDFAELRFGPNIMTFERLDSLFASPVVSHLLVFTDSQSGKEVGVAVLYLEGDAMVYYYYAFYDLNHPVRSLGLYMMTSAVEFFAGRGSKHIYLGTCYSERALYKTQFAGLEFFNGFRWSPNLAELHHLLKRDQTTGKHLLETEDFRTAYYPGGEPEMAAASVYQVSGK